MDEYSQQEESKFLKKIKENPTVPIGLTALVGIVGYQLFNVKKRTKKLSLYLIELRLLAQGTLMAFIVCGAGYKIYTDVMSPKPPKPPKAPKKSINQD